MLKAHIIGLRVCLPFSHKFRDMFPQTDHAIDPPQISIPATPHSGVLTNRTSPNLSSTTG
ncbi:hypothetical protein [Leclercia adecarboxylata]|uniref:hypothetical protein n=1 Tax=Leclercia adecarboxylata TaxID=83655 RepID=UPI003B436E7F